MDGQTKYAIFVTAIALLAVRLYSAQSLSHGSTSPFKTTVMWVVVFMIFYGVWSILHKKYLKSENLENLENLRSSILNFKPGTWTSRAEDGNFWPPPRINIGIVGVQNSGKSSLINSFVYALKGTWEEHAVEGTTLKQGGQTIHRIPYRLTQHITVTDNRGMKDFSISYIDDVLAQLRGERGINIGQKISNGERIHCPVLVYHYSDTLGNSICQDFLSGFIRTIRTEYGSYPIMIVTFADSIRSKIELENALCSDGMPQGDIHFIENYTVRSHVEDIGRSVKLLKIMQACIKRADDNIVSCDSISKERPVQENCVIQ